MQTAMFEHGAVTASQPHVTHNSGDNEWYTPAEYIEIARKAMGSIDLDPASSAIANMTVNATTFYTAQDNGLSKRWYGNVWMNPPYAKGLIDRFCSKAVHHCIEGDINQMVILVNNATETGWFQELASVASVVCFPQGRVRFLKPGGRKGSPLQGQVLIYIGRHGQRFKNACRGIGFCVDVTVASQRNEQPRLL